MKTYGLPDMQSSSRAVCTYIINGKSYNFKFVWCDSFFIMDIYILEPDEEKYILKSAPLVVGYDFIARVKTPDLISGKLYLKNKYDEEDTPSPDNLNSDFELIYYTEDESVQSGE